MIISAGRSYIFVHIPKTGGTSLALALEGRAMKDDIMLGDTPKALKRRRRLQGAEARGRLWKHATLADIEGLLPREKIASMFCFTLVRNPWDRMVSYYHWLREQSFEHDAVAKAKALSFGAFVHDDAIGRSFCDNPYASYMRDGAGHEVAALYIRLEHFEEDAAPLWEHLGFRLELPRENVSQRRRDYRSYYSDADSERVGEICHWDAARFGYCFAG
ncbi:sulfotransferase family protein [Rhodobacteraceae bacterium D3-12]|nr:sulfotransferase family protein [Rhodobacteraceae bacterium D3-12]